MTKLPSNRPAIFAPSLLLVATVVACGSSAGPQSGFAETKRAPAGATASGSDGTGDNGGPATASGDPTGGGSLFGDAGAGDGSAFCQTVQGIFPVKADPTNILFLIDRSGSMHIKLSDGGTRWSDTKAGLISVMSTLPATTRAGAMMFPQGDTPMLPSCCGIDPESNDVKCAVDASSTCEPGPATRCDQATYETGVDVDTLDPEQQAAIGAYIGSSDAEFYWGTPMAPALDAALSSVGKLSLDGTKAVILLTDGYPTSCSVAEDDISSVVTAASTGAAAGVKTFVMGVIDGDKGAKADNLAAIAVAGGTTHHYEINAATFATDLAAAFQQISTQTFDCTFTLPPAAAGTMRDPDKVNVQISGGAVVPRDASHQSGWDYLSGTDKIELYGDSCNALKADSTKEVSILVGCDTQIR